MGLGFRGVSGLGFRVQGSGFGVGGELFLCKGSLILPVDNINPAFPIIRNIP